VAEADRVIEPAAEDEGATVEDEDPAATEEDEGDEEEDEESGSVALAPSRETMVTPSTLAVEAEKEFLYQVSPQRSG